MTQEMRFIDPDRLLDVNQDYMERIERDGLRAVYDGTLDTLFIEIGGPKEGLSEHLADNVMLRIDPESLQIIGLEILDFLADFLPHNRLFKQMVEDLGIGIREGEDAELSLMEPMYAHVRQLVQAIIPHGG